MLNTERRKHVMELVARKDYTHALLAVDNIGPHEVWERLWRAQLHRLLGDPRAALEDYEHVLDRNPTESNALLGAAFIYSTNPDATLRDGPRALKYAQKLQALDAPACHCLALLAASYAECGDFVKATECLQDALTIAPEKLRERLRDRLEGYRNSKPCRISDAEFRSDTEAADVRCAKCGRPTFFSFNEDGSLRPLCLVCAGWVLFDHPYSRIRGESSDTAP